MTKQKSFTAGTKKDFNSHAHVERDLGQPLKLELFQNFNSHAHVERDSDNGKNQKEFEHFNSHAHVERDRFTA